MSKVDDVTSARHMLDAARKALRLSQGKTRSAFETDEVLALALARLLEITGEAANRVSEKTRQENPTIPWAQVIGMRNRLIHGYDVVDEDILWKTITEDLPSLIESLERLQVCPGSQTPSCDR